MKTRLAVGVSREAGYLRTALEQSGVPVLTIDSVRAGLERGVRVFAWNRPDPDLRIEVDPALALITDHALLGRLLQRAAQFVGDSYRFETAAANRLAGRSFYIENPVLSLPIDSVGTCYDADGSPIAGTGLIVDQDLRFLATAPQAGEPQASVGAQAPRRGLRVTSLPWNLADMQLGDRWGFRPHYSPTVDKHFVQVGSRMDSGAVRRLLFELVALAFQSLGLPLVRLRPFLRNERHVSIRIDADGYSPESTASVLGVAQRTGMRFTWFIDVGGWARNLDALATLVAAGQDVQLHCYYHKTYRSRVVNLANIRIALRCLAGRAIYPKGIVSPSGLYFDGFREATRQLGFRYSSEFGFATDDLPAYPRNDRSYPLQVPVHVGALWEFRDCGFSPEDAFAHWEAVTARAADQDGVGTFYEHPLHRLEHHEPAFENLLRRLLDRGYKQLDMSTYADEWARRIASTELWCEDGTIDLSAAPPCGLHDYEVFAPAELGQTRCTREVPLRRALPPPGDVFRHPPGPVIQLAADKQRGIDNAPAESLADWYVRMAVERFAPTAVRRALRRLRRAPRPSHLPTAGG